MEYNEQKQERVILAGVHRGMRDALWDTTEESIHELGELVKTAGGIVVGEMIQTRLIWKVQRIWARANLMNSKLP